MRSSFARAAVLACALMPALAGAGELADFNAAVETAAAHNRIALGYLRTGNADLAALEIDRMRETWGKVASRFAKPPDALTADIQLYRNTMLDITTRLVTASMMLDTGRPQVARDALVAIRDELSQLRKVNGIVVLADCVKDAGQAMDELFVYNDRKLDWSKLATSHDIAGKASVLAHTLTRCDGLAGKTTRESPEFRRLIDGAKAGLALIPNAVAARDADLLHRVLIELRSFDNLLAFRFG